MELELIGRKLPAVFSFLFLTLQNMRLGAALFWMLFPIVFIAFVIMFIVGSVIYGRHQRQKRIQALQFFAAQNGWTFVPRATSPQFFQNAHAYSILNHRSGNIIALLQRPHDGGTVSVFDYSYTVGSGKNRHTHAQTVVAFHTPRLMIPFFALYPESFFSFIGEMFGAQDIDFHTHPAFSKNFKLAGRDEMPIRQFFHPQALSFFERLPRIRVDGGGNYLFVYILDETFKAENLNAFLDTTLTVYNLFRR